MRTFILTLGLALLGLVEAGPTPESKKLHEQMTLEEVKQVFNTEPHAVPEYDVVPIHWPRLHKRSHKSSTKLHVKAFGHNITLWLNPTDGILVGKNTPVYLVKTEPKNALGIQVLKVHDAMTTVGKMLEDRDKQASFIARRSADGRTKISGYIASEGWVVKPLPERISNELNNRRRRSAGNMDEHIPTAMSDEHIPIAQSDKHIPIAQSDKHFPIAQSDKHIPIAQSDKHIPIAQSDKHFPIAQSDKHIPIAQSDKHIPIAQSDKHIPIAQSDEHIPIPEYHVVYKTPELPEEIDYATMPLEDDITNNIDSDKNRSTPAIIYPQILNMVDYKTYKIFGENLYDLLEYLVTFWNGVDLRYRGLESPKVRLNIAAMVIAADATALSFISQNEVGSQALNIFGALDSLGKYMPTAKVYFPNDTYDVAVALSPLTMCSPTVNLTCELGTLGLAYLAGACTLLDYTIQKSLGVAVIHDEGAYDGIHSAAHELGHLFGSNHDGQEGSVCTTEHGNIMAPFPVLNEHSNDWSNCTLNAFNTFFNTQNPKCLFNKPETISSLPRTLPGRIQTMDQQCEKFEGTKACNTNAANICQHLRCVAKANSQLCVEVIDAPADGSVCGEGKICLHGQCLAVKDFN